MMDSQSIPLHKFHQPTAWQRKMFERLVSVDFPSRTQVKAQLETSLVCELDENGTVEIKIDNPIRANVVKRIPIEAQCADTDGMMVHVLLHVVGGIVSELEIYKDDSSKVLAMPDPSEMEIVFLGA